MFEIDRNQLSLLIVILNYLASQYCFDNIQASDPPQIEGKPQNVFKICIQAYEQKENEKVDYEKIGKNFSESKDLILNGFKLQENQKTYL
jgi:hypothetical protein